MTPGSHLNSDSDLESVISTLEQQQKPRRNSTGPKYFCTIEGCQEVFKRLDHLDRHEYKHTGKKKHVCTYEGCDKSYTIVTHLKRHVRCTHERTEAPTKTVPCSVENCDKMFQSLNNMERHVREVHENPKVYHCLHCGEKFTQRLKMRRHEVVKHTKQYPYNCEKCHKGFHLEWLYERHVGVCKIYPCSDCTLEFDKWSAYIAHCKQTKHGRKYYKCEHCDRIFFKPGELEQHITAKHADDELKVIYRCPHENCERAYIYKRNLLHHERTAHAGKRFDCTASEDCGKVFKSAQTLQKHMEREHVEGAVKKKTKKSAAVRKQRNKRKDAGGSVLSNLAKLSSLAVNRELDKQLRVREWNALNAASEELQQTQCESTSDDDEDAAEQDDDVERINDCNMQNDEESNMQNDEESNVQNDEESNMQNDEESQLDAASHAVNEKMSNVEILNLNDAVKSKLVEKLDDNNESEVEKMELEALIAAAFTDE